jgi:hypothetical protein
MTKISNIRNSFKKIEKRLLDHDISCIFFNNHSTISTTIPNKDCTRTHQEIFEQVRTVRCQSITDFSKIEECLQQIEHVYNDSNTISIIISDGYHTNDETNGKTTDEIKQLFFKRFDYSLGIGDFDSNLLQDISKECLEKKDNNLFHFLFNTSLFIKVKIPKDVFFVSDQKYTFESTENEDKPYTEIVSETWENDLKESLLDTKSDDSNIKTDRFHYIFIIDNSGSMDDGLYSILLQPYFDQQAHEENFYYDKFHEDKNIIINQDQASIYMKYNDRFEFENVQQVGTFSDIVNTCFSLYESESMSITEKLDRLYTIKNFEYKNKILENFVKFKYETLLSNAERRYNSLLHESMTTRSSSITSSHTKMSDVELISSCSICMTKEKNILFSCSHVACCSDCVRIMLESIRIMKCPICRQSVKWIRKIYYDTNFLTCRRCNVNLADCYQNPCEHTLYCVACCDSNEYKYCSICDRKIEVICKVHFC